MGRQKKIIPQKTFENLCGIQCTESEICSVLDVSDKTLNAWCRRTYGKNFSEVFKEKRALGKASLRRSQFELAKKNATMGIWLGKQYLGQTDKIESQNSVTVDDGFLQAMKDGAAAAWEKDNGENEDEASSI